MNFFLSQHCGISISLAGLQTLPKTFPRVLDKIKTLSKYIPSRKFKKSSCNTCRSSIPTEGWGEDQILLLNILVCLRLANCLPNSAQEIQGQSDRHKLETIFTMNTGRCLEWKNMTYNHTEQGKDLYLQWLTKTEKKNGMQKVRMRQRMFS